MSKEFNVDIVINGRSVTPNLHEGSYGGPEGPGRTVHLLRCSVVPPLKGVQNETVAVFATFAGAEKARQRMQLLSHALLYDITAAGLFE